MSDSNRDNRVFPDSKTDLRTQPDEYVKENDGNALL